MSGGFANPALPSAADGVTACVREEHCAAPSASCAIRFGKIVRLSVIMMRSNGSTAGTFRAALTIDPLFLINKEN
jgi:hypothetical protein